MRGTRVAVASLAVFIARAALGQQEHPNRATGERSETLYAQSGQDEVNLFNGSLSYRIPIGEGVQAGPRLRLAPELVYNATPLRNWNLGCNTPPGTRIQESYPSGDRIFGHGWQMHFGRVAPVNAVQLQALIGACSGTSQPVVSGPSQAVTVTMNSTGWGYQEPDGAVHEFFDRQTEGVPPAKNCWTDARAAGEHCFVYAHDASFLRMDPKDPEFGGGTKPVVYFPDGIHRVMGFRGGRTLPSFTAQRQDFFYADIAPDFGTGNFVPPSFHTTEIADPFGNKIVVRYYGDPLSPAHPLAAYSVPTNQWDAIPYQAYADSYPSASYYFDIWVGSYNPIPGGPAVYIPYVYQVRTPTSSTQAPTATDTFTAILLNGPGGPGIVTFPILAIVGLPAGLSYSLGHSLPNQPPFLTQVTLPSGGLIQYDWGDVKLATKQPNENCSNAASDCYVYQWDTVTGVTKRRAIRNVRTAPGGATSPETAETSYFRTYLGHTDPVSQPSCITLTYGAASCQMRVDQWTPLGLGSGWNVTRSTFYESDGYVNTALYGRPFQVDEFFPATSTSPSRVAIDNIATTPVRRTTITYDYDSQSDGHSHNTRESLRKIQWCGGSPCSGGQRYWQTQRFGWDNYGHFGKTITSEAADGLNLATLKSAIETHLNRDVPSNPTTWILDPVTRRTVSSDPSDTPPAAVSTTELFSVNPSNGFIQNRTLTADDAGDSRVLTTTWFPGSAQYQYCTYGGIAQTLCNNRGFVQWENSQLTGSRTYGTVSEPSAATSYTRNFYYQYGIPSAWFDSGTNFYGLDNDLSVCGKVLSSRGTDGRTSVTGAPSYSTLFEYDLLGRVTKRTPYGEWPEVTSYTAQTALTSRCGDVNCGSYISTAKSYFDELGRSAVSLRSMPGAGNWTYRVATLDTAGRAVSGSEWQPITCGEVDPCSVGASNLLNLQATISGSGSGSTTSIPGSIRTSFDLLGRPQVSILTDGSLITDSFAGWWQQLTTRTVNQPPSNTSYTYNRDALGRLESVVEPATATAKTGACMNNPDTTTYTYDAFDRLTQASKTGTDASCASPTIQTRSWLYDDFGWLVREQTPEVPSYEVRQRDGRGNIIAECTGPTSSCGPTPTDHSTQDRLSHCYDLGSRLLSSTRDYDRFLSPRIETNHCDGSGTTASFEDFYYDSYNPYPGVSLNYGRSNGRLVYNVRHNLAYSNHETINLGWFAAEDLYQYAGVGGRLSQRQMSTFLIGGLPTPMARATRESLAATKPTLNLELARYFINVKRNLNTHIEGLATALTTTSVPGQNGRAALDAAFPNGWFNWQMTYDSAGRLTNFYYPRRDDVYRTYTSNTYDRGWLTTAQVTLRDPFTPASPTTVTASLTYGSSGSQTQASISTNTGGATYTLYTPDQGNVPRIGAWNLFLGSGAQREYRTYVYDGSSNVTSIATSVSGAPSATYSYDLRSHLTRSVDTATEYRDYDSFGNIWKIDNSLSGVQTFAPELTTNRHIATGSGIPATYDATRGTFLFDGLQSRNVGRDYYADGRPMSEYSRTSGSYGTDYLPSGHGFGAYLVDGRGERVMTFHSETPACDTEFFRQTIRDEAGTILTDYKVDNNGQCACGNPACQQYDRFERDYVKLGSYTLATQGRSEGAKIAVLDHLGSPRRQFNAFAAEISQDMLDAWGQETGVSMVERTRFTGHERNHVNLDGGLPISDYMHARTYVPMLGRFTSPDIKRSFSLFNPGEMNRYAYTKDNPTTYVDPRGETFVLSGCGSDSTQSQCDYQKSLVTESLPTDAAAFVGVGPGGRLVLTGIKAGDFAAQFGDVAHALADLISSPRDFTFNIAAPGSLTRSGGSQFNYDTSTLSLDPAAFPSSMPARGEADFTITAQQAFVHELGHAVGSLIPGFANAFSARYGISHGSRANAQEGYATNFENRFRLSRGQPIRFYFIRPADTRLTTDAPLFPGQ